MVKRLAHVSLYTEHLERLVTFYCQYLDCSVVHEFSNDAGIRYGVFLAIGNSHSFIEIFTHTPCPKPNQGRIQHFCFEVDDITKTAQKLSALGQGTNVTRGRTDHILQFSILDPDGNEIEFHQYDKTCTFWDYLTALPHNGAT